MPVYNVKEDWLRESIESILNQTYSDFEFIIFDDGSDMPIDDVIKSYNDDRILLLHGEGNHGVANALNECLKVAKGEFIARMDADDISVPERFAKQIEYFSKNPNISILGSWYEAFPDKYIVQHPSRPKYFDLLEKCCMAHPSVMFRKSDFEKFGLKYNPDYKCEDYDLWSRAVRVLEIDNIQEVLLKYRVHENNCSQYSPEFKASIIQVQQNMLDFLTKDLKTQKKLMKYLTPRRIYFIKYLNIIKKRSLNLAKKIKRFLTFNL